MQTSLTRFAQNFFLLASLISLVGLSGCATTPTSVAVPIERAPMVVPQADVIKLDTVKWLVVTEDNAKSVFDKLKEQGDARPVLYSLTDKNFEKLTINTAKVQAFVTQQQAIISAYKAYYVDKSPSNVDPKVKSAEEEKAKGGLGGKISDLFKSKDAVEK